MPEEIKQPEDIFAGVEEDKQIVETQPQSEILE